MLSHLLSLTAVRRGALTLAAVFALACTSATSAHAAAYQFQTCGENNIYDGNAGWTQFGSGAYGAGVENRNQCSWGGMHSEMLLTGANRVPVTQGLGWRFTPPTNTYIKGVWLQLGGWVDAWDGTNHGIITIDGESTGRISYFDSSVNTALWNVNFPGDPNNPLAHLLVVDRQGMHDNQLVVTLSCDGVIIPNNASHDCVGPWSTGWMSIFNPAIGLADDNAPTAGGTSGSMISDTQYKGTEALNYSANDLGGGISRFRLYVDGQRVQDYGIFGGRCDPVSAAGNGEWVFSAVKPCPSSASGTATLDTTSLSDGQHTITAKVVDAAQQEATVFSATRTVVNHAPVNTVAPSWADPPAAAAVRAGDTLTAKAGTWTGTAVSYANAWQECDANGGSCTVVPGQTETSYKVKADDAGHRLRFVQTATNIAGSKTVSSSTTGVVPRPDANGSGDSVTNVTINQNGNDGANGANGANGTGGNGGNGGNGVLGASVPHLFLGQILGQAPGVPCPKDTAKLTQLRINDNLIKLRNGKTGKATVLLTCAETGKAIIGAKLDVTTKISGRPVASTIVTGGDGLATLSLAKGPSRSVTIGYRMYSDDPIARATTSVKVSVPARISIKANKKVVRNGNPVKLTGTLVGGYLPKRGVALGVQWMDRGHWRTFAQARATGKGKFSFTYRFTRTNYPVRYRLRVTIIKGQVDYPYTAVNSKAVRVSVRP